MNTLHRHILRSLTIGVSALALFTGAVLGGEEARKEIGRTTERELSVVLSSSFGKVTIGKGAPEKIILAESFANNDPTFSMIVGYDIRNRIGYLDLSLGEEQRNKSKKRGTFTFNGFEGGKWDLKFSNAIPISFDVELGVAKGDFNFTGLQVKDFKLSAGASDVSVAFDKPNTSTIDEMSIECGVGKFVGRSLGNANFKSFRFEGGVGSATLDFSGTVQSEVDIDVQVGMGVCTIIIPKEVGARIFFEESLVSKLDCDRSIRSVNENEYVSDNFRSASGRMNIRIDSGLGRVTIKRN